MSDIGKAERVTQNRVVALFRVELGYRTLGDWTDRIGNSNVEESLLTDHLTRSGYSPAQITRAIHALRTEADNHNRSLYGNNQAVYGLLHYGVPVKIEADGSRKPSTSSTGRSRRRTTSPLPRKLPCAATASGGPTSCCT